MPLLVQIFIEGFTSIMCAAVSTPLLHHVATSCTTLANADAPQCSAVASRCNAAPQVHHLPAVDAAQQRAHAAGIRVALLRTHE
jgi:hypothetical protein